MKRKKRSLRGLGGWVCRDKKEDENKRKKMLKCGVGIGKKNSKRGAIGIRGWGRERGEEREGEGIREGNLGM